MSSFAHYLDQLFFAVFPFVAMVIFFLVTIQRYRGRTFTFSSLSSQFLENEDHFWGMVPFHFGIIFVLIGHVVAFLLPAQILSWNASPIRLILLELTGMALALFTLVGLLAVIIRRVSSSKVRVVTSPSDWVLYLLLLVQVASGVYVALFHPWGSSWFAAAVVPWLWSLVKLSPNISYIAAMPFAVKLHIVNAFIVIAFFPFTRLVHILVLPNPYPWRKTQVVRWYGIRRTA